MKDLIVLGLKIIVLSLILAWSAHSQEIQALLEGPEDAVNVGDVVSLELTVWPRENVSLDNIKSLEGKKLGETFSILSLSSLKVSENNEQAFVAKVYGVFLTTDELPEKIELGAQPVKLLKRSIEVTGEVSQIEKLHVFKLMSREQINWYLSLLGVLLLVIIVGWFFKRRREEKMILLREKQKVDFWKTKLRAAQTRVDIEELYALRSQWGQALNLKSPSYARFCEYVEKIQYKKKWNSLEEEEVNTALNDIRREIEA